MGTREEQGRVREAIRVFLEKDRAAGELKAIAAYKNLFPGFWDLVAEEFEAVSAAPRAAGAHASPVSGPMITSGLPAAATTPGPGGVVAEVAGSSSRPADRIGPYRILRELGRGGMGVVYEAQDSRLPRRVALKVLGPQFASSAHLRLRFQREAELASRLDHPHICTVYEAGEDDGAPYLAMRYVEGRPLSDLVASTRERIRTTGVVHVPTKEEAAEARVAETKAGVSSAAEGRDGGVASVPPAGSKSAETRLDLDRVLVLFEKAARALHNAHERGLIHRDIKPHNIMVTEAGEPVLLDFGLAREEEGEGQSLTQTGSLMGTPAYLSPEQLAAHRIRLDRRTDIYSFGVTLYECLTLRLPFEAPTLDGLYQKILMMEPEQPRRLNRGLPRDLEVVVATAIDRNRERRYQTALALAEDLRRVREHEPISARPAGPVLRLWRWAQRRPAVAASVTVAFMALVTGLTVSQRLLVDARRERDAKESALRAMGKAKDEEGRALEEARRERDAKIAALAQEEKARERAEASLKRARVLGLASASAAAAGRDSMEALLLAREAVRLEAMEESVSQLHAALLQSMERGTIRAHADQAYCARFSPRGDLIVSAGNERSARIWTLDGELKTVVPAGLSGTSGGSVESVEFSPDGMTVLAGAWNGTASIWDLQGNQRVAFPGDDGEIRSARFSPDGQLVLTVSGRGKARLWRSTGEPVAVLGEKEEEGRVLTGSFSMDGRFVLTAGVDGTARTWDLEGRQLSAMGEQEGVVRAAAFSPDGEMVVTATLKEASPSSPLVTLWRRNGERVSTMQGHEGAVLSVCFSPKGDRVLTGSRDGTARLWDLSGRQVEILRFHGNLVSSAVFSPDGSRILTVAGESGHLWDLKGREVATLLGHEGAISSASFSPDGTSILTAAHDGTVRLWALRGQELPVLGGHEREIIAASFVQGGRRIVTSSNDGTARVWDLSGRQERVLPVASRTVYLDVHPRSSRFVTRSDDDRGQLWDVGEHVPPEPRLVLEGLQGASVGADGSVLLRSGLGPVSLLGPEGALKARVHEEGSPSRGSSISRDGRKFATSSGTKAHVWSADGTMVAVLEGHKSGIYAMEFSPDALRVITGSFDGSARVWSLDGGDSVVLTGHESLVVSARFSPDGEAILTGSWDSTARLWDGRGRTLSILRGHAAKVTTAEFSPDGDLVLTASQDGTARLWDRDGNALAVLRGHDRPVLAAQFSPTGNTVLTASADGTARLWLVDPEELLELADRRCTRSFSIEERRRYRSLLGKDSEGVLWEDDLFRRLKSRALVIREIESDGVRSEEERAGAMAAAKGRGIDQASELQSLEKAALDALGGSRMDEAVWVLQRMVETVDRTTPGEFGHQLNGIAWDLVKSPGRSKAVVETALLVAEKAVALRPDDGLILNTLGVAQYRAGRFPEAVETLRRSESANSGTQIADTAFRAMALWRSGRVEEARREYSRLKGPMGDPRTLAVDRPFLEEAREVIDGPEPPGAGE